MKFTKRDLRALLGLRYTLTYIKDRYEGDKKGLNRGLCILVARESCASAEALFDYWTDPTNYEDADVSGETLWSDWKHFSGNDCYPVPCTFQGNMCREGYSGWDDEEDAEELAREQYEWLISNYWLGRQGELRYSLLRHCLKKVEAQIKELEDEEEI